MKFNPALLPEKAQRILEGEGWSEMPDGRGNTTMAAIAGALRKQGMDYPTILRMLLVANKLTMTRDPMPGEMVEQIARSVSRYEPDPDIDIELVEEPTDPGQPVEEATRLQRLFKPISQLADPRPTEWLWHPYLPKGKLTVVEGREGIGKGMYCVWLAYQIVTGSPFVPGDPVREPETVMWFSAEDDPQDDIQPRLQAVGYKKGEHPEVYFSDPEHGEWAFPKHMSLLLDAAREARPGLIIMDPGRTFLAAPDGQERNSNSEDTIRPGMQTLLRLTRELDTTVLFVHHQNKREDGDSRARSGGSGAIRQVARHVVTMEMVGNKRAMAVEKANHVKLSGTVASWDVVDVDGTDTARFSPGGTLPDYKNIDEWREVAKKSEGEIIVEHTLADLRSEYAAYDCDKVAPSVKDIAHDLGINNTAALQLRKAAIGAKLIVDNKWKGCRSGAAEGAEK